MRRAMVLGIALALTALVGVAPLTGAAHASNILGAREAQPGTSATPRGSGALRSVTGPPKESNPAIDTPGGATAAVYDPTNQEVYVTDVISDQVRVINTTTNTVNATISIPGESLTSQGPSNYIIDPSSIGYDPDNLDLYVADSGGTNVTVINTTNNSIVATVVLPSSPNALTVDAAQNLIYVAADGGLAVINGSTNSLENYNSDVCLGSDVAIDANVIYVSCWSFPYIDVVAFGPFGSLVGSIPISSGNAIAMVYDPDSGDLYAISDGTNGIITVINASTYATVDVIPTYLASYVHDNGLAVEQGAYAQVLAILGGGPDGGTVVAVNPTTQQLLPPTDLATEPLGIAVDPTTGTAYVTDSFNQTEVVPTPATVAPAVLISPNHPLVDANETETFTTTVSGAAPFSYTYVASSSNVVCAYSTGPTYNCTSSSAGLDYNVAVGVTDFYGLTTSDTSPTVTVGSGMTATLAVSNSTPLLGQTVAFVTTGSGGAPPYSYNYTGLPPGCVSQDTASLGCLPTQADFYNVTVTVMDQNGGTRAASVSVHVIFDFNVVVPTNTSVGSPFTISVNTNATFSGGTAVVPASGFGGFSYNYSGLPPGCASKDAPSVTCTPTQVGTYHINVTVHDAAGADKTHTVVVHVVPAASFGARLLDFFTSVAGLATVGGIVVTVAIAGVLLVRRGRRQPPKTSEPAGTEGASRSTGSGPDA